MDSLIFLAKLTRVNSSPNLASQAGRCSPSPWGRNQFSGISGRQSDFPGLQAITSQAGTHLPPGEGSNLAAQSTQSVRQAGAHLPPGEGSSLAASQAGSQASQAVTSQAGAILPPGEGSNLAAQATQSGRQAGAHLPPREGSSLAAGSQASQASQAGAILPPGEGSNSAVTPVVPQVGNNLPTSQAVSQGTRHSARQRTLQASQGNSTTSQTDSAGFWESNLTPIPQ